MKKLGEKAIYNHLHKAFLSKYGEYEDTAAWYVNPKPNEWVCDIKEMIKDNNITL